MPYPLIQIDAFTNQSFAGNPAAVTYFALRLLGYPRVRMYDGSWAEWGSSPALPVEK